MTDVILVEGVPKRFCICKNRSQSFKNMFLQRSCAQFEEFQALDDAPFEIPQGRTFSLLGHNGSGESTPFKCIAKILTPGRRMIPSAGRMVAMPEVGSGFHLESSDRENIYLNGAILGMSKKETDSKLDVIIDFSGVERFTDQPVESYSSGMYIRLGFSVSIHVELDIPLVDEVLVMGDTEFQNKCMDKFAQLRDQGRTAVAVSHGPKQMHTFCDQAVWLDHDTLVDVGAAAEVVDIYFDVAHHTVEVEGGSTRLGSGEVMIECIELLSVSGQSTSLVYPGDPMCLRLYYRTSERIESPAPGASINTREGVFV